MRDIETLLARWRELEGEKANGPFDAYCAESNEPVKPDIWFVIGPDTSLEATLCELWSGEHDNEQMASLIALLLNLSPVLLRVVKGAWRVTETSSSDQPDYAAKQELRKALAALTEETGDKTP